MPSLRFETVGLSAKPNNVSWRIGGRTSEMARRRSWRIWANSFVISARTRRSAGHPLCMQLHPAHAAPCDAVEHAPDEPDDRDLPADRRPAAALQECVAHDFDVIAPPDEVRDPPEPHRDVLDRKDQSREQEHEEKAAERDDLHRRDLARDERADHRAE